MKIKRVISLTIVLGLLMTCVSYAAFDKKQNIIAKRTVQPISPGLTYSESIEVCDDVRQEIYSFKLTPGQATRVVPAYGNYIYGFNSLGKLISDYDGNGAVVGGINTDFFITSTGIPLSCLVDEGEIISSCDNRAAIGFKEDSSAVIGYPKISAELISDDKNIPIAHINKTPGIWGAYLVTDKFARTTNTSVDSIEIVFRPYDEDETTKNIEEYNETIVEGGDPDEKNIDDGTQRNIEVNNSNSSTDENLKSNDIQLEEKSENENKDANPTDVIPAMTDEADDNAEITPENNEKTVIEESETIESIPETNLSLYAFTDDRIKTNCELDVVVTEIRRGVKNGDIEEGTFVLCIPEEQLSYLADGIDIEDRFTLKVANDEIFEDCISILGAGSIIVENGKFVKQENDSIYRYRNPRTAAGITEEGDIIFVCVDGRRTGFSAGYTISELADYLISLGCVTAVNFDGGGSTTFYAKGIGEFGATLKNTPSEGVERKVADGLLFINSSLPSMDRTYASISPNRFLTFNKNVAIDISGKVGFADSNFHPINISDKESIQLTVDDDFGYTYQNYFIPNGKVGTADIIVNIPESGESYYAGFVDITNSVNKLSLKGDVELFTPFIGYSQLFVSPLLNTIPVRFTPYSIDWTIEYQQINENDEDEWIIADESDAYIYVNDTSMYFIPIKRDSNYKITASMGDYSEQITIFVESHPFYDMENHWASETSYEMFKSGLINGELDLNGTRVFMPSRNITVAEFCAILARALGLEITYDDSNIESNEQITDSIHDKSNNESNIEEAIEEESDNTSNSGDGEMLQTVNSSIESEEMEFTNDSETELTSKEDSDSSIKGGNETSELPEFEYNHSETENDKSDDKPEDEENIENKTEELLNDVPQWAKGYVHALIINGFIDELMRMDENQTITLDTSRLITRMDVVRVLGGFLDGDINHESLENYVDFIPENDNDLIFLSRMIENGIITGYEDGSLRQDAFLTRAEAATVFSRFLKQFSTIKNVE